jgi:bacterioferritin
MGSKGREILGMNVDDVLGMLNKAYADEWLAYYQYWIGAKISKGPMKDAVNAELLQHAADELRHADMVALRIIQLGGTPLTHPKAWLEQSNCGYDEPADPYVGVLLDQNILGEQCAITVYKAVLDATRTGDPVTYNMVLQILQDEVEHEEDLQSLKEDLDLLLSRGAR